MTSAYSQDSTKGSIPRYAVVLKTYDWDPFIARQAARCAASIGAGDFFVSADETRGPLPELPYPTVGLSEEQVTGWGLAHRAEKGALFWWSADYPHYHFQACFPEYDFYIFVEYDALYVGCFDELVSALDRDQVDFAAFPLPESKETWPWTERHLRTYTREELEGCLMCISAYSRRALAHLAQCRFAMSSRSDVVYWPSAEVFLPTEIKRAGLRSASLEAYADTSSFSWQPPRLEEEVLAKTAPLFAHPVYDRARYVRRALAQAESLGPLLRSSGPVRKALAPLPLGAYLRAYIATAAALLLAAGRQKLQSMHGETSAVETGVR